MGIVVYVGEVCTPHSTPHTYEYITDQTSFISQFDYMYSQSQSQIQLNSEQILWLVNARYISTSIAFSFQCCCCCRCRFFSTQLRKTNFMDTLLTATKTLYLSILQFFLLLLPLLPLLLFSCYFVYFYNSMYRKPSGKQPHSFIGYIKPYGQCTVYGVCCMVYTTPHCFPFFLS